MKLYNLFFAVSVLIITGCGANIDHQEVKKAPRMESELGLIATEVTPAQHNEIMAAHPAAQFRNHGNGFAYEYRGLTKAEILELAPQAKVEKNEFVQVKSAFKSQKVDPSKQLKKFLAESPEVAFAPGNCTRNTFLVTPRIDMENISAQSSNAEVELGQKVGFKNNKDKEDDAVTAWMIIPPNGSKLESELLGNEAIAFTPDMAGNYAVALLYKKNGQCNFSRFDFFVTNNSPYVAELSSEDKASLTTLSNRNFYQTSATKADAAQALVLSNSFKTVKVAVLDSGVNYNNPALKSRMWTNTKEIQGDGVDNDQNGLIDDFVGYDFADDDGQPMDDFGHGSHVAGLVAGEFMGSGSENVQIIAVKVGGARGPDLGSIISGILYAVDQEADVINMSFGSARATESIKAAIKKANEAGILVVAASGNGDQFGLGINNDKMPHYPSSYDVPNILAVGSVRIDDALTRYSNFGAESVDVATVGGFSDRISGPAGLLSSAYIPNPAGVVTQPMAGTSMAAPVAAGIAGMILSVAPDMTPAEVITLMIETSRSASVLENKIKSAGVLDAEAAVLSALGARLD